MRQASEDGSRTGGPRLNEPGGERLDIKRNDAQRLLLINDIPIQFSPLEYRVVVALTERIGAPVSFEMLTHVATWPGQTPCSRAALERHIDRIRLKLWVCALEIRGVSRYGCVLLASWA